MRNIALALVAVAIFAALVPASQTAPAKPLKSVDGARKHGALPVTPEHLRRTNIRGPTHRPTLVWKQITAVGEMNARPTLSGQFAYIQTGPNILSFFQAEGWIVKVYNSTAPASGLGYSSPLVDNGVVYFGAENGYFFAYDVTSGNRLWAYSTQAKIQSSAVLHNGTLYFADQQDYYYAVDAATGNQVWKTSQAAACQSQTGEVSQGVFHQHLVFHEGNIYFGSGNNICSISASTGTVNWWYTTQGAVQSTVLIHNSTLYVGSGDYCFYNLNLQGEYINSFCSTQSAISSSATVSADGTAVYYADDFGTVTALHSATLELIWSMNYFQSTWGALSIVDDVIIAPMDIGLIALDRVTGDILWWFDIDHACNGGLAINGTTVFFGDVIGTAYALKLNTPA